MPALHHRAQHLFQAQCLLEAEAEDKTTVQDKWIVVESIIRKAMAEAMTALDALGKYVNIWTVCDPVITADLLRAATTEEERLEIVLGTQLQKMLDEAEGICGHGEA